MAGGAEAGPQAANPAALSIEQLDRATGLPAETIRRHVEEGHLSGADGRVSLIQYAAWLNMRLLPTTEDTDGA